MLLRSLPFIFNKNIDAKEATYQKQRTRPKSQADKYCTYNVTENPNGTRFIDFITTNVPKDKKRKPRTKLADYNIYRFRNTLLGEESTFMIVAYKEKSTGDAKGFQNQ